MLHEIRNVSSHLSKYFWISGISDNKYKEPVDFSNIKSWWQKCIFYIVQFFTKLPYLPFSNERLSGNFVTDQSHKEKMFPKLSEKKLNDDKFRYFVENLKNNYFIYMFFKLLHRKCYLCRKIMLENRYMCINGSSK